MNVDEYVNDSQDEENENHFNRISHCNLRNIFDKGLQKLEGIDNEKKKQDSSTSIIFNHEKDVMHTSNSTLLFLPQASSDNYAEEPKAHHDRNNKKTKNIEYAAVSCDIKVGDTVVVEARTWPGINKPGGPGRIIKVSKVVQDGKEVKTYDVRYLLGGTEKSVEEEYVIFSDLIHENYTRSRQSRNFFHEEFAHEYNRQPKQILETSSTKDNQAPPSNNKENSQNETNIFRRKYRRKRQIVQEHLERESKFLMRVNNKDIQLHTNHKSGSVIGVKELASSESESERRSNTSEGPNREKSAFNIISSDSYDSNEDIKKYLEQKIEKSSRIEKRFSKELHQSKENVYSDEESTASLSKGSGKRFTGGYHHLGEDIDAKFIQPEDDAMSLPDDVSMETGFIVAKSLSGLKQQLDKTLNDIKQNMHEFERRQRSIEEQIEGSRFLPDGNYDSSILTQLKSLEKFHTRKLIRAGVDIADIILRKMEKVSRTSHEVVDETTELVHESRRQQIDMFASWLRRHLLAYSKAEINNQSLSSDTSSYSDDNSSSEGIVFIDHIASNKGDSSSHSIVSKKTKSSDKAKNPNSYNNHSRKDSTKNLGTVDYNSDDVGLDDFIINDIFKPSRTMKRKPEANISSKYSSYRKKNQASGNRGSIGQNFSCQKYSGNSRKSFETLRYKEKYDWKSIVKSRSKSTNYPNSISRPSLIKWHINLGHMDEENTADDVLVKNQKSNDCLAEVNIEKIKSAEDGATCETDYFSLDLITLPLGCGLEDNVIPSKYRVDLLYPGIHCAGRLPNEQFDFFFKGNQKYSFYEDLDIEFENTIVSLFEELQFCMNRLWHSELDHEKDPQSCDQLSDRIHFLLATPLKILCYNLGKDIAGLANEFYKIFCKPFVSFLRQMHTVGEMLFERPNFRESVSEKSQDGKKYLVSMIRVYWYVQQYGIVFLLNCDWYQAEAEAVQLEARDINLSQQNLDVEIFPIQLTTLVTIFLYDVAAQMPEALGMNRDGNDNSPITRMLVTLQLENVMAHEKFQLLNLSKFGWSETLQALDNELSELSLLNVNRTCCSDYVRILTSYSTKSYNQAIRLLKTENCWRFLMKTFQLVNLHKNLPHLAKLKGKWNLVLYLMNESNIFSALSKKTEIWGGKAEDYLKLLLRRVTVLSTSWQMTQETMVVDVLTLLVDQTLKWYTFMEDNQEPHPCFKNEFSYSLKRKHMICACKELQKCPCRYPEFLITMAGLEYQSLESSLDFQNLMTDDVCSLLCKMIAIYVRIQTKPVLRNRFRGTIMKKLVISKPHNKSNMESNTKQWDWKHIVTHSQSSHKTSVLSVDSSDKVSNGLGAFNSVKEVKSLQLIRLRFSLLLAMAVGASYSILDDNGKTMKKDIEFIASEIMREIKMNSNIDESHAVLVPFLIIGLWMCSILLRKTGSSSEKIIEEFNSITLSLLDKVRSKVDETKMYPSSMNLTYQDIWIGSLRLAFGSLLDITRRYASSDWLQIDNNDMKKQILHEISLLLSPALAQTLTFSPMNVLPLEHHFLVIKIISSLLPDLPALQLNLLQSDDMEFDDPLLDEVLGNIDLDMAHFHRYESKIDYKALYYKMLAEKIDKSFRLCLQQAVCVTARTLLQLDNIKKPNASKDKITFLHISPENISSMQEYETKLIRCLSTGLVLLVAQESNKYNWSSLFSLYGLGSASVFNFNAGKIRNLVPRVMSQLIQLGGSDFLKGLLGVSKINYSGVTSSSLIQLDLLKIFLMATFDHTTVQGYNKKTYWDHLASCFTDMFSTKSTFRDILDRQLIGAFDSFGEGSNLQIQIGTSVLKHFQLFSIMSHHISNEWDKLKQSNDRQLLRSFRLKFFGREQGLMRSMNESIHLSLNEIGNRLETKNINWYLIAAQVLLFLTKNDIHFDHVESTSFLKQLPYPICHDLIAYLVLAYRSVSYLLSSCGSASIGKDTIFSLLIQEFFPTCVSAQHNTAGHDLSGQLISGKGERSATHQQKLSSSYAQTENTNNSRKCDVIIEAVRSWSEVLSYPHLIRWFAETAHTYQTYSKGWKTSQLRILLLNCVDPDGPLGYGSYYDVEDEVKINNYAHYVVCGMCCIRPCSTCPAISWLPTKDISQRRQLVLALRKHILSFAIPQILSQDRCQGHGFRLLPILQLVKAILSHNNEMSSYTDMAVMYTDMENLLPNLFIVLFQVSNPLCVMQNPYCCVLYIEFFLLFEKFLDRKWESNDKCRAFVKLLVLQSNKISLFLTRKEENHNPSQWEKLYRNCVNLFNVDEKMVSEVICTHISLPSSTTRKGLEQPHSDLIQAIKRFQQSVEASRDILFREWFISLTLA